MNSLSHSTARHIIYIRIYSAEMSVTNVLVLGYTMLYNVECTSPVP